MTDLRQNNRMEPVETAVCKICCSSSAYFANAIILKKHEVKYFKCVNCGFIQTEDPYWLEEAYAEAIYGGDVGLVERNIKFSNYAKIIISFFFNRSGKFVDYGGGYGLFVRLMRDRGFDFYRHEIHCQNIFAKNLEADTTGKNRHELVTAIEVFEHFVNPLEDLSKILKLSRNILFTTQCVPSDSPKPDAWWYYGLMHGQHISLYTLKSLKMLTESFGLNFYSNGTSMHLMTDKQIPDILFKLLSKQRIIEILAVFIRRKSYLQKDSDSADLIYG